MADPAATPGLSLWRGGLFYRFSARFPGVRREPLAALPRSLLLLAVAWVPFLVLALLQGLLSGIWTAELWHAAVSKLLARFFVLRWIQRWCIWTLLLRRIAKLELRLSEFEGRWLHREIESPLGSADIQSLADLGNSHQVAKTMRLVPFPRDFIVHIVLAALVPLLPVYLSSVSAATLVAQLAELIF